MRENPFKPLYDFCNLQNTKYKLTHLPEVPRYLDIELTNTCNFKCLFCPTGTGQQRRKKGLMSDEVYCKIINEAKQQQIPIRFIRWGEPILHPKHIEYIREANKNKLLTHLTTNASLLDDDKIDALIDIPLDSIKFSFQGVDRKSYSEMRSIDFFNKLIEIIALFYKKRGDKKYPYIHVSTTITYESKKDVDAFKKKISAISDSHQVGRTVLEHIDIDKVRLNDHEKERLRFLKEQESVIKIHAECHQVFDVLSINWDGSVSACCRDYDNMMIVGDIKTQTLHEIWNSSRLDTYRKLLAEMKHELLPLCCSCYDLNQLRIPGIQEL